jgi:hypothetical protein
MHPWGRFLGSLPPPVAGNPYWLGWNIVRGMTTFAFGMGGVVLDAYGGLHRFASPGPVF